MKKVQKSTAIGIGIASAAAGFATGNHDIISATISDQGVQVSGLVKTVCDLITGVIGLAFVLFRENN